MAKRPRDEAVIAARIEDAREALSTEAQARAELIFALTRGFEAGATDRELGSAVGIHFAHVCRLRRSGKATSG